MTKNDVMLIVIATCGGIEIVILAVASVVALAGAMSWAIPMLTCAAVPLTIMVAIMTIAAIHDLRDGWRNLP